MNICGAAPERGNQGVPTSLLLTPGMPSQSLIVLRMMAPADDSAGKHGRMPNIASYVVDDAGRQADQRLDHVDHQLPAVAQVSCREGRAGS